MSRVKGHSGFTLIEIVATIVVMGVLVTMALQAIGPITQGAKVEDTRREMDELANATAGNPNVTSNGERSDFGYVGDVGALPTTLDNLLTNPGSYTTWNGPYLNNDFTSWTTDIITDAWNISYTYSQDSARISSSGSGSTIIRQIAANKAALVINKVIGTVIDRNGTPPGAVYKDSVSVQLTIPNGSGSTTTKMRTTDIGGYFTFDSIPIGRHKLNVIYSTANDTATRYVSVPPASQVTTTVRLNNDHWNSGTGSVVIINANFDLGTDGFTYADDLFRSTSKPAYANGAWTATGYSGGGLSVSLGAVDNTTQTNMSGGWAYTFSLTTASVLTISFRYRVNHVCCYESNEYNQVLISIDGTLYGTNPNDYVYQFNGDNNDAVSETSNWLLRSFTTGSLAAGSHTVRIGGFNNQKTTINEGGTIIFDNFSITR